jgi:eukaryotic-like serine/threonine-protein kinase
VKSVTQAEQEDGARRSVALKALYVKSQNPVTEAAKAFKGEALILAGLFQPHLPRIYDHFADAGRWYLIMDFIVGETLTGQGYGAAMGYRTHYVVDGGKARIILF